MASEEIFSDYIPLSNSGKGDSDNVLSEGPVLQNSPPRQDVSRESAIDRSDSLLDRTVRNLQEIELTAELYLYC